MLTHNLRHDNGMGVFSEHVRKGLEKEFGEAVALTTVGSGLPFEQPILYPNKVKLIAALPRIRRIVKGCDVVHAMDAFPYGVVAALAAYGLRKKMILTAVGTGSVQLLYHRKFPDTAFAEWSYRQAAAITAISRFTRDAIIRKVSGLHIEVINPGIDYEAFAPSAGQAEDAERYLAVHGSTGQTYAVGDLRPYILSVGTIRWRKGYKVSLRAFARVREQFPQLKYVIVGKRHAEKFYQELLRIIRELGMSESVVFLDQVDSFDAMCALYRNAELFCLLPQTFGHDMEGFGIVFLEAAAAGLPVVGSKGSGIEDAVEDGVNGFLVDCRDERGFTDKIMTILGDRRLRENMNKASLAWARNAGWEKRNAEYAALYRNLSGTDVATRKERGKPNH